MFGTTQAGACLSQIIVAGNALRDLFRPLRPRSPDLDPPRLGGLCRRQRQLEHPMLERRSDILGRDVLRECESPLEPSIPDLRQVPVGLFIFDRTLA